MNYTEHCRQLQVACCAMLFFIASFVARSPQTLATIASPSSTTAREVIDGYCVGCHNAKRKTGGMVLNGVDVDHVEKNPELWEKVIRKLRVRDMPPNGSPRPDEKAYDETTSY